MDYIWLTIGIMCIFQVGLTIYFFAVLSDYYEEQKSIKWHLSSLEKTVTNLYTRLDQLRDSTNTRLEMVTVDLGNLSENQMDLKVDAANLEGRVRGVENTCGVLVRKPVKKGKHETVS